MGLLLLRVVVGLLFVGHGTQKLFGWFGGHGIQGTAGFFDQVGYPRARRMATLAAVIEAVSGALLTLGLLTPLAVAGIIGVMVNAAVAVHADNGLWNTNGGFEYNLVLATAAAALAYAGPGALALDDAFGWDLAGPIWGTAAIAVGLAAATTVLSTRSTAPTAETGTAESETEEAAAQERRAA